MSRRLGDSATIVLRATKEGALGPGSDLRLSVGKLRSTPGYKVPQVGAQTQQQLWEALGGGWCTSKVAPKFPASRLAPELDSWTLCGVVCGVVAEAGTGKCEVASAPWASRMEVPSGAIPPIGQVVIYLLPSILCTGYVPRRPSKTVEKTLKVGMYYF